MPSLTVENYCKALLQIGSTQDDAWVSTGRIALAMNVSPGTVTSMLKTLAEAGLAEYRPYSGASLTTAGRSLALRVLRRHRLIEQFLVQTLKFTWDEVHAEAENLEHAVSDLVVDRMDAFLGFPKFDPHGDPIPTAEGSLPSENSLPLTQCAPGNFFRVVRVLNQETEFLKFLTETDLRIGTQLELVSNTKNAGVITVRYRDKETALGQTAAEQILVEPTSPSRRPLGEESD